MEYIQLVRRDSSSYPGSINIAIPSLLNYEVFQNLPNASDWDEEKFMLAFDVSMLKSDELKLEYFEDNTLKVIMKHGFRENGNISVGRCSVYVYKVPKKVKVENLAAFWTADDFLIIREIVPKEQNAEAESANAEVGEHRMKSKNSLEDLVKFHKLLVNGAKSITNDAKALVETAKRLVDCDKKREDCENKIADCAKGEEDSKEKISDHVKQLIDGAKGATEGAKCLLDRANELVDIEKELIDRERAEKEKMAKICEEELEDSKPEFVSKAQLEGLQLIPTKTDKVFKPRLSVIECKQFMSDIEKRMSFANSLMTQFQSTALETAQESNQEAGKETQEETAHFDMETRL